MTHRKMLGIRVDVDTHEGMRDGVPRLLEVFAAAGVRATFYLSLGPDRSGRALLNLLQPGFLAKMRRTSAPRIYGWRTIFSGTLLPARPIAIAFPELARQIKDEGHETGVHAWDHRTWQDSLLRLPEARIQAEIDRGHEAYRSIFGSSPTTYAAPAWLSNDCSLALEDNLGLEHASDCRGTEPFLPLVAGRVLSTPQVPATLPTLDELLGWRHSTAESYFRAILEDLEEPRWPVLTIHAELEGGPYAGDFARFLSAAIDGGYRPGPLGELLEERLAQGELGIHALLHKSVPGRHGVLSHQETAPAVQRVIA